MTWVLVKRCVGVIVSVSERGEGGRRESGDEGGGDWLKVSECSGKMKDEAELTEKSNLRRKINNIKNKRCLCLIIQESSSNKYDAFID